MLARPRTLIDLMLLLVVVLATTSPTHAAGDPYRAEFTRWDAIAGGFAGWARSGVALPADGTLRLDPQSAQTETDPYPPGGYHGHNFYNGGRSLAGAATSPIVTVKFGFAEAIASWNVATPSGTWIETQLRVRAGSRWTAWYNMGVWASDSTTIKRHSVNQRDADGRVAVDTLILEKSKPAASAFQVRLRLFTENLNILPTVRRVAVAVSTTPQKPRQLSPGDPHQWNKLLAVPSCSQMVYSGGGEAWCSPTSTSMVIAYWRKDTSSCAPRVRAAVGGVADWLYGGEGNWPFNTAYVGTRDLVGYVARFTSLTQVERWVAAGVPVIISYAWKRGELRGAPVAASSGHLAVVIGFDTAGQPVVNDPAAPNNATVQRTYRRSQLESLWLEHSGGTVYLIYPQGWPVPDL